MPSETYTASTDWVGPADVTRVLLETQGEAGESTTQAGGTGGRVFGVLFITEGETLYFRPNGASGGLGGGPSGTGVAGGDGGAAADVRRGGTTLSDRISTAAGGGGAGGDGNNEGVDGGAGGPDTGEDGADNTSDVLGGHGGTQSAGGDAQDAEASDGSFGTGGDGDDESGEGGAAGGGGGGGAGQYGGAGGAGGDTAVVSSYGGAGGGGGSNYDDGLDAVSANERGTSTRSFGNGGQVLVAYTATPQNLTVTSHDATSITLDWDAVTAANTYTVYRATASGSSVSDYTQIDTTATVGYTDTGLLNGERYFYVVTATDTDVAENPESDISAEVNQVTDLPAPTNLTHPSVGDTTADYSWTANANNGTIRVEYKDADTATWQTFSTVSNTTEAETVTGLLNGTDYDSRVVAQTEHTESVDT